MWIGNHNVFYTRSLSKIYYNVHTIMDVIVAQIIKNSVLFEYYNEIRIKPPASSLSKIWLKNCEQ